MMLSDNLRHSARWYRVAPLLVMLNTVAYIDRYNVGYALASGIDKDLGMNSTFAGFASGIFFWGYLTFQYPGGRLAEAGFAKPFITVAILFWSLLTIVMGFVHTGPELAAARFLVGVAEGGIFPAIYTILANWFPNREAGRASALFITNTAIASLIAGPLSGFVLTSSSWRVLFLIEGFLSLAFAAIWIPLMSETPAKAAWLGEAERAYLEHEFAEDRARAAPSVVGQASLAALLSSPQLWLLSAIYFCYHVANGGYVTWLPVITKTITRQGIGVVSALASIPFIISFLGLYIFGTLSDCSQNRRFYLIISMLGFAFCLLACAAASQNPRIFFVFLAASGLFLKPTISLFWTLPPLVFDRDTVGGARGIINGIGNLGGFVGPIMIGYALTTFGRFSTGVFAVAVVLVIGALLTMLVPSQAARPRAANATATTYTKRD